MLSLIYVNEKQMFISMTLFSAYPKQTGMCYSCNTSLHEVTEVFLHLITNFAIQLCSKSKIQKKYNILRLKTFFFII